MKEAPRALPSIPRACEERIDILPDLAEAQAFIKRLDPTAVAISFATFDDVVLPDGTKRRHQSLLDRTHGTLNSLAPKFTSYQQRGAGVFVTINETNGEGFKKEHIIRVRAVYQDDDQGYQGDYPIPPHITVESSPSKYQRYWLVDGMSKEQFTECMAVMVAEYGADNGAKDLARVLRLPGFYHQKGEPFLVRVVEMSEAEPYPAEEFMRAFGVTDAPVSKKVVHKTVGAPLSGDVNAVHPSSIRLAMEAAQRTCADPGRSRHKEVYILGNILRREGVPGKNANFDTALNVFKENMRPTDTNGVISPMSWEAESKAIRDGYFNAEPDWQDDTMMRNTGAKDATSDEEDVTLSLLRAGNQDSVALAFRHKFQGEYLFNHSSKLWHQWDGCKWRTDTTRDSYHQLRRLARTFGNGKSTSSTASFVSGVEKFCQADPAFAITADALDGDRFLLNTPDGVIDLLSNHMKPHDPLLMQSLSTAVGPVFAGGGRFLQFMEEITCNDRELIEFHQITLGSCLSGAYEVHGLLFWSGYGRNGKSTLAELVAYVMGDYCGKLASSALMQTRNERHPVDKATLKGLRLALSSEVQDGSHWDEALLNELTGDAVLTGRWMHGNPFTFGRTHKHLILGNHRPQLRNSTDALKARFNIVPFNARFQV